MFVKRNFVKVQSFSILTRKFSVLSQISKFKQESNEFNERLINLLFNNQKVEKGKFFSDFPRKQRFRIFNDKS